MEKTFRSLLSSLASIYIASEAFAKDVPVEPDAANSAAVVDDTPLVDPQLLFDQRRVKEWSK
jgi:hypothetical protein